MGTGYGWMETFTFCTPVKVDIDGYWSSCDEREWSSMSNTEHVYTNQWILSQQVSTGRDFFIFFILESSDGRLDVWLVGHFVCEMLCRKLVPQFSIYRDKTYYIWSLRRVDVHKIFFARSSLGLGSRVTPLFRISYTSI